MAAAQKMAMANSWRLRRCRSCYAPAGEPFLCRTERPLRSLRQRLVLAGIGEVGQRYACRELVRAFNDVHPFPSHLPQAIGLLLVNALGIFAIIAPLRLALCRVAQNLAGLGGTFTGCDSDSPVDDFWDGWNRYLG